MPYSVVIIDDEPWTREVVKSLGEWERLGLTVVGEASDGDYGLQLVRQLRPDIIIADVRMPYLNGIDLLALLRREDNDAQVIIISGYDDYSYIRSALQLNAVDYLLKPVKPQELNAQLERCTERLGKRGDTMSVHACFINAEWADAFYQICGELAEALHSTSDEIIDDRFEQLRTLVRTREPQGLSKENMIGLYYALMDSLHRHILTCGCKPADLFSGHDSTFVFSSESTFNSMLDFARTLYQAAADGLRELQTGRNRLDIGQIRQYIDEHYCEGITLEDTARRFFVSKEYLSKIFKQKTGEGFAEYVAARRMQKARELICELSVPVKEASEMVGYTDLAHFYKTFKRVYGKTPVEMRDALKIDKETD